MKGIFILSVTLLAFAACDNAQTNTDQSQNANVNQAQNTTAAQSKKITNPADLLTINDVEIILAGKATLTDSMTSIDSDVLTYKSTHIAHDVDSTGKLTNFYFMHEEFPTEAGAMRIYKSIKESNMFKPGFMSLGGMGDEAYYQSDGENFIFFMSRKGNRIIRLKVNKVTEWTSLDAFKTTAKRITDSL